jgi:hypothetical protein
MKLWHKIGMAVALAVHGKNALATGATVVAAGVTAAQLGADPWPWIIGAMGSTVVYAHKRGATTVHSLSNGVVSVFMGGVGAPYAGVVLSQYVNPVFANTYFLAGVMSAAWPWALPFAWLMARRVINAMVQPPQKGGGDV